MKIGLLTMVFNNNYGGLLQAYALQTYLKGLGHDVVLINAQQKLPPLLQAPYSISKRLLFKYILNKHVDFIIPDWVYRKRINKREREIRSFISKYFKSKTKTVYTNKGIQKVAKDFECYIVGSDQVWRSTMYPFIDSAFFGFVKDLKVKKISYAASFGTDIWEYTEEQTKRFKREVQLFDFVSVRELSGVDLCKRYFDVEAHCLVDPTMLLDREQYEELIDDKRKKSSKTELQMFCYFLDETEDKIELLNKITSYKVYNVKHFPLYRNYDKKFVFPTVSSWLNSFKDADFVLTDSFHGCVFSIIFNKPFLAYGNVRRGLDRFVSLLNIVGLKNRLIFSAKEFHNGILSEEIDWSFVNERVKKEQCKTSRFFHSI